MASREFRNDPRRNNFNNLMKKAELYVLETTKKSESVKPEPISVNEKAKQGLKPNIVNKTTPTRVV